jgi:tetratricopeptide (TPR) repeat protein
LGKCLEKQWHFNAAALQYHKALALQPNHTEIYQKVSEVLEKQQQVEQGKLIFKSAQERYQLKLPNSLTKTPDPNQPKCQGLDCQPCLKKIRQQFKTELISPGVEQYFAAENLLENHPNSTVTIIPQGRAWVAPQTSWWNVCNAIAILNSDNELIPELSQFYPTPLPGCQNYDWSQHQVFGLDDLPPLKVIKGRVAVLSGLSGNVYFHWMVDILPRIKILEDNNIDFNTIDGFLINSTKQRFQRETLEKMGIPRDKIIESDQVSYLQASSLIVPSYPASVGWVVPSTIKFLRNLFLTDISPEIKSYPKRIYISRNQARYRRLLNEPEILEYLNQLGFVSIELETLTVQEQADLFSQAEVIIAPHGAGLTNLVFCQRNTVVVELVSPHYIRPYYWLISQQLGLKHYSIQGEALGCSFLRQLMYPNPLVEDLQINVKSLETLIQFSDMLKETAKSNYYSCDTKPMMLSSNLDVTALENGLKKAKEHLTKKNFEEAILVCKKVLNLDNNCAEAYTILGKALQLQGNFEQAQASYEKAIQLQPDLPEALGNLGSLYAKQQQWELAVEFYKKALKYKPDCDKLYRNLAKVLTKLNRTEEATECWYHAYRLQPDLVSVQEQFNLGKTLLSQGKIEFAISCFRQALKQDPNCKEAQAALKTAQQQATQSKKIAPSHTKPCRDVVCSISTENETEILKQAEQDLNHQLFKKAIAQCQQVIDQSPNQGKAYEILGKAFNQLGRLDLAIKAYRKLVKFQPQNAIAYTNLGNLYAKQKQWKFAVLGYKKAIALNPNLAVAYRNLAQVLNLQGKQDIAIEYWYQGFSLKPEAVKPKDHLALGNLFLNRGRLLDAAICYRRAIWFDPNYAEAHHNLGEVLAVQGQWDEAIAHYQQALQINPKAFETYNSLGKALVVQGRWQEVLTCYHQALELNPRLLMALQNLTQALIHRNQSLQGSHNSNQILQMLAGTFLSGQVQMYPSVPRRELQASEFGDTWTTTAVSVGASLEESSQYQQALRLFEQGRYQDCIHDCEQLAVSYPQAVGVYWLWGKAWAALGNGEKAKHCYQQGIKLQPQQAEGYLKMGEVYTQEGNWKTAIACYQKAIQFQPSAFAYQQLSQGWQVLGNQDNAEDCLYEALRLEPEQISVEDCLQLGDALVARGQRTQAMICYGQALVRDPHRASRHPLLEKTLTKPQSEEQKLPLFLTHSTVAVDDGNENQSNSASQKPCPETVEQNQAALLEQADQYLKLAQWQACVEVCRHVIEQKPQSTTKAYRLMAQALQGQGQITQAQQIYEQLQQLQPEDPEVHEILGDIYAEQEQWEDAIQSYQKTVHLNPNFISVQEALGDIWLHQGQPEKAIACYQQVLQKSPELWEVHHKLGDVLWQQGEVEAAAEAYQQAAALSRFS